MTDALRAGRHQQHLASKPGQSAWVAANAGTGKTKVLVERVIRLLLAGTAPDRILCLTFTKAAAAEMSERLFSILGGWTSLADQELVQRLHELDARVITAQTLADARRLFARAIETPGGLKIQTIHAFAQALLRRFPREAKVAPHFAVMDDREARVLLAQARDFVFGQAKSDPVLSAAIETLVPYLNEEGIDQLLAQIGLKRNALRHLIRRHGSRDQANVALRQHLGIGQQSLGDIDREQADPKIDRAEMVRALKTGSKTDQQRAAIIQQFIACPTDANAVAAYIRLFFTDKGEPSAQVKLITANCAKANPLAAEIIYAEQDRLIALEDRRKAVHLANTSNATLVLGLAVLDQYEAEKHQRARLDYDDLIERSLRLLSEADAAPWVLFKLDGGLEHVLVDEAQDTSPAQWDIVRALTDEFMSGEGANPIERTVFAVGDAKQSIYSFQGADPSGFERMRHYFQARLQAAKKPFQSVDLTLSFRSTREVLAVVDAVFEGTAAQGLSDDNPDVRHVAARAQIPGRVELWETEKPAPDEEPNAWTAPLDQTSNRSPKKILAERIAAKIAGWLQPGGELIVDDRHQSPTARPIRPGDILILVRRRDQFVDEMIRALKQAHIPVAGADRMRLDEQIAVMDLAALARVCLLPDDDLSLACLLKSPLMGFDDDDLFDIAHDRGRKSLWASLLGSDRPRDKTASAAILEWRSQAQILPPFDFFARILNAGGRRRLLERLGPEANDPINELLAQALNFERMDTPTLEGFIHWLSSAEVEIKRDMDQSGDLVRVMTVHGAKGLEANIVFLPDTCTVPTKNNRKSLIELGAKDGFGAPEAMAFAPLVGMQPTSVRNAQLASDLVEGMEQNRLLYVALTRARNWLYICGHEGKGKSQLPPTCWYNLSAAPIQRLGQQMHDETGARIWRVDFATPITGEQAAALPKTLPVKLPAWIDQAPAHEGRWLKTITPSRIAGQDQPTRASLTGAGTKRYRRGRLIHRLLQTLPDLDPASRAAAAHRFLAHAAPDLDPAARAAIADETLGVLSEPAFAALFGPGAQAEVAIAGRVDALGDDFNLAGQVDRLCVTADQVLIVDYKTNRPPPARVEDVQPLYIRQMAAYRAALRDLFPDRAIVTALLWTDGPRLMALPDELLDKAMAEMAG